MQTIFRATQRKGEPLASRRIFVRNLEAVLRKKTRNKGVHDFHGIALGKHELIGAYLVQVLCLFIASGLILVQ